MGLKLLSELISKPILKAAATSATVLSCGDVLCQTIQQNSSQSDARYDLQRTARFGIIGLTLHGPLFYTGFRFLEARLGSARNMRTVLAKVAANHMTLFPAFHVGFFTYMPLLEGGSSAEVKERLGTALLPAMATGTTVWPLLNVINFKFVPTAYRVLYVSVGGLLWNAYLSWVNSTPNEQQPQLPASHPRQAAMSTAAAPLV